MGMGNRLPGKPAKLNLSVLIFFISLLFTVVAWDYYLRADFPANRFVLSTAVLVAGLFFSISAGLMVRSMELYRQFLEDMLDKKELEFQSYQKITKLDKSASTAICWLSQMIFANQRPESLLDSAIDLMKKVLQCQNTSIMLLNENNELYIAYASGIPPEVVKQTRLNLGERVVGRAARLRKEYLLVGSLRNYSEFDGIPDNSKVGSAIICPMVCNDQVIGVLSLSRQTGTDNLTEAHLRYALVFASQIAQILWNHQMDQMIRSKLQEIEKNTGRQAA